MGEGGESEKVSQHLKLIPSCGSFVEASGANGKLPGTCVSTVCLYVHR